MPTTSRKRVRTIQAIKDFRNTYGTLPTPANLPYKKTCSFNAYKELEKVWVIWKKWHQRVIKDKKRFKEK